MSKTPETDAALAETLRQGFDLGPEHKPVVGVSRSLETRLGIAVSWMKDLKERQTTSFDHAFGLSEALAAIEKLKGAT